MPLKVTIASPGSCRVSFAADPLTPKLGMTMKAILVDDDQTVEMRLPTLVGSADAINLETGEPVVGAMIEIRRPVFDDNRAFWGNAISGENGEFRVPGPCRGKRLAVTGNLDGFLTENSNGNAIDPRATIIDIPDDRDIMDACLEDLARADRRRNRREFPVANL